MANGLHLLLLQCMPRIHPIICTHRHTSGGGCQARRQPAHREQFVVQYLAQWHFHEVRRSGAWASNGLVAKRHTTCTTITPSKLVSLYSFEMTHCNWNRDVVGRCYQLPLLGHIIKALSALSWESTQLSTKLRKNFITSSLHGTSEILSDSQ